MQDNFELRDIVFIDPQTRKLLRLVGDDLVGDSIKISLNDGIYRFVESDNYSASFGYQWNRFEKTQIDREQNTLSQSHERLQAETNWDFRKLSGNKILEVGCGAGRFSQVILDNSEADLYSLDYSNAAEVNFRNNGENPKLNLFQASIYEMPFDNQQFDKVLCLGVLQHTPDFRKSVECLCNMVKPGGELVVDFYEKRSWLTYIHAKYILRPLTKKMSHKHLLKLIERNAKFLISIYKILYKLKLGIITRFLPICDIYNTLPKNLDKNTLREWVILDTFDMFSPQYDQPQSIDRVTEMVSSAGLKVTFAGHVVFSNNMAAVVRAIRE